MTGCYARALLVLHHIRAKRKKVTIQQAAKVLNLTGICKIGYPGILAVEGEEKQVREFIRIVKVLRLLRIICRDIITNSSPDIALAASQVGQYALRAFYK